MKKSENELLAYKQLKVEMQRKHEEHLWYIEFMEAGGIIDQNGRFWTEDINYINRLKTGTVWHIHI